MSPRGRLDRLGRQLGVPTGPRQRCPRCDATGLDRQADGCWIAWEIECSFLDIEAQLTAQGSGERYVEPQLPPEPGEPLVRCSLCRGLCEVAVATVAALEGEGSEARRFIEQRFEAIERAFGFEDQPSEPSAASAKLRAVPAPLPTSTERPPDGP